MEKNEKTTPESPTGRREEVIALRKKLMENNSYEEILSLLQTYAKDADWMVRFEVAKCLAYAENDQISLFSNLFSDSNEFVSGAANNAVERRNSSRKEKEKLVRLEENALRNIDILHAKYGDEIAQAARNSIEEAYCQTVGHAAHDIRGVVAPIEQDLDRIFTAVKNEIPAIKLSRVSQSVESIKDRINMLLRILNDMQAFAKKTPQDRSSENLKSLIEMAEKQAFDAFSVQTTNASEVKVKSNVSADLSVFVSKMVILRAISNLIKNALESHLVSRGVTKRGLVLISAEKCDDGVKITIRDQGIGMDQQELARIRTFMPRSTSKKSTGSGFGLAIAFSKIRDHGGLLEIDSEGIGLGTTATITLPSKGETK